MDETIAIRFQISTLQLRLAIIGVNRALKSLATVFEDRDKFYAACPGQWPDEFTVLNRFMRTGLRPPYIINS